MRSIEYQKIDESNDALILYKNTENYILAFEENILNYTDYNISPDKLVQFWGALLLESGRNLHLINKASISYKSLAIGDIYLSYISLLNLASKITNIEITSEEFKQLSMIMQIEAKETLLWTKGLRLQETLGPINSLLFIPATKALLTDIENIKKENIKTNYLSAETACLFCNHDDIKNVYDFLKAESNLKILSELSNFSYSKKCEWIHREVEINIKKFEQLKHFRQNKNYIIQDMFNLNIIEQLKDKLGKIVEANNSFKLPFEKIFENYPIFK